MEKKKKQGDQDVKKEDVKKQPLYQRIITFIIELILS